MKKQEIPFKVGQIWGVLHFIWGLGCKKWCTAGSSFESLGHQKPHFWGLKLKSGFWFHLGWGPFVCYVCYGCGMPESPLPLNPGQGSDSPGKIAATRSISVRGQRCHVPYPRWPVHNRHVQSRGSVAPMILPPRAWGNWYGGKSQTSPSISC